VKSAAVATHCPFPHSYVRIEIEDASRLNDRRRLCEACCQTRIRKRQTSLFAPKDYRDIAVSQQADEDVGIATKSIRRPVPGARV
jgi:hypothetical protein